MRKYADVVLDPAGNALSGAVVSVTELGGAPAALFHDAAGTQPYAGNSLNTDSSGNFEFYVADGRYNLGVVYGGIVVNSLDIEVVDSALFASRLSVCEGFNHYLSGPDPQMVIVTPDVNGDLSLTLPQAVGLLSDPTFRDLTVRKLRGDVAHPPTLVAWGTGVGASAVPTSIPAGFGTTGIDGTDLFVKVGFTTSASPAASQPICTIAWGGGNGEFATAPDCPVVALGRNAMGVVGSSAAGPLATGGPNGIVLTSGPTPLAAATTYQFGIIVHGK